MVSGTPHLVDNSELTAVLGGVSFRVNAGVLQRSTNGGTSWTAVESPPSKQGWGPEDQGALGWTGQPEGYATAQLLPSKSQLHGVRVWAKAGSVTAIGLNLLTIGATLTAGQNKAAFFSSAGAWLGTSVDQSTVWSGTAGYKECALPSAVAITSGYFDIVFWANGTTAPSFSRLGSHSANNSGLSGQGLRFFVTADNAVTTDAPTTLGNKSISGNISWWASLVGTPS